MMSDRPSSLGTLYGIGVGPGDPDLITVKAVRLLKRSPVVAFPAGLHGKQGLAQRIVAPWLRDDQIRLPLNFAFVTDADRLTQCWKQASDLVWPFLQQGMDVVFCTEGDVGFYSTFTYLAQTLQEQHPDLPITAIPGICSPMAAAATLGIPLTVRAQRLTILPALYTVETLEQALTQAEVVVLMKVNSVYEKVWNVLKHHDLLHRSYIVERATQPGQVIYADLSDRPSLSLPYFSLLIVQVTDPNPLDVHASPPPTNPVSPAPDQT